MVKPFFEIGPAQDIFELYELSTMTIGSGRPQGPRNTIWGTVVVLSRAALEAALERLHQDFCEDPACLDRTPRPPFDRLQFVQFYERHKITLRQGIPESLHLRLFSKNDARAGDGSGVEINGPMNLDAMLSLLQGFNHIRNGFAHLDSKKIQKLPTKGEGVLWVKSSDGTSWTVQKPHALSVLRLCHTIFRHIVLSHWGEKTAFDSRTAPARLLKESLLMTSDGFYEAKEEVELILVGLEKQRLRDVLTHTRRLKKAVLKQHYQRASSATGDQLVFDLGQDFLGLSDPRIP